MTRKNVVSTTEFTTWLKSLRNTLGISQLALAKMVGCTQTAISELERGLTKWPRRKLYQKFLGLFNGVPAYKGSMQPGSMTPRILQVCLEVSRNGVFGVSEAEALMKQRYPTYFDTYQAKFASQLSAMARRHLEHVYVEGFRALNLYRIRSHVKEELDTIL